MTAPSLEVGLEEARQTGNCDNNYSCAYCYIVSWKTETQPLPPISDPRNLFERLFGSDIVESPEARARRLSMRQSILDEVMGQTQKLEATLGGTDKRKLDEYLTSVREIEQQVARVANEGTVLDPGMEKPFGIPPEFPDYYRLMTDMMLIAFKADITRISTLMIGREGSVRPYPEIGIADGHHLLRSTITGKRRSVRFVSLVQVWTLQSSAMSWRAFTPALRVPVMTCLLSAWRRSHRFRRIRQC